jgi:hypothetical protein
MIFHRGLIKKSLEPIRELLCEDWDWFKRDFPDHLRHPLSQGMCCLTTAYLYNLFAEVGLIGWKPREGHPIIDEFDVDQDRQAGGMLSKSQEWSAHTWLEHDQGWILDLTADQFGYSKIIITKNSDYRYKHNLSNGQVMERINSCKLSIEWLKHHMEEPQMREVVDDFKRLMHQANQISTPLPMVNIGLEQASL